MHPSLKLRALCGMILALLASGTTRVRAAEAARPVFPFPINSTVLDNGLTVITVPCDTPGVLSYYTIVRTGSRNEIEPGLSGLCALF